MGYMNRGITAAILIIVALAAIFFFAWPKLKPYMAAGSGAGGSAPRGEVTSAPL